MISERFSIAGKVAVVTGGTRGIGLACARALCEGGAKVVITGKDPKGAAQIEPLLRSDGFAQFHQVDVASPEAVTELMDRVVRDMGGLDILINNAGITYHGSTLTLEDRIWREIMDVNLSGSFWCAREAARHMTAGGSGGAILNIGSISGLVSNIPQHQAAYNTSKAGVHMLTKTLASEFAAAGIRVNAVAPGYIATDMTAGGLSNNEWQRVWQDMTPMGRIGLPEEVASVALFLVSPAASYVTGAILTVDGGYTIR